MAPRTKNPVASTSAVMLPPTILPPSLTGLTPANIKALKQNILTEHFGWAPESFAKQGNDAANNAMYAASAIVENSLKDRSRAIEETEGIDSVNVWDEEEISLGMNRLETLLEAAIDKHFDLFEIYVLRNTFAVKTELIPFIELRHQTGLHESMMDEPQVDLLQVYEEERQLYEDALREERELNCALEFMERKVANLREKASEVGYMGDGTTTLTDRTQNLLTNFPLLQSHLSSLLNTPIPTSSSVPQSSLSADSSTVEPWGTTRASYINWAAAAQVNALPEESQDDGEAKRIGELAGGLSDMGSMADAQRMMAAISS